MDTPYPNLSVDLTSLISEKGRKGETSDENLNLLLIEDNPGDARLVQEALLSTSTSVAGIYFHLHVVGKLSEGLDWLSKHSIDLVLLDLNLPDSFGFETFHRLHQQHSDVPIIVLSGVGTEDLAVHTVDAGAQDYIFKDNLDNHSLVVRTLRYAVGRYRIQRQLKVTEDRLRTVIGSTSDGLVIIDLKGKICFANRAAEAFLGAGEHGLIGRAFPFPIRTQGDVEAVVEHSQGGRLVLSVRTTPTQWDEEPAYCAALRNVTERVYMEQALHQSERRLRMVVSNVPVILFAMDPEGTLTVVDGKDLQNLGVRSEDLVGKNLFELAKHNPEVVEHLKRALQGEEFTSLIDTTQGKIFETIYSPARDQKGNIVGVIGISVDITERRLMEKALQQERTRLNQIISEAPIAMAMFDKNMCYVTHSKKWLSDYQLEGHKIIGRSLFEVLPAVAQKWRPLCERALRGESLSNSNDVFDLGDGSAMHLRWAIHPLKDTLNEVSGIIVVTDCINELVEARKEAENMTRLKSQFLANMSHEIRTPMNGVIGMTSLLMETHLNTEQKQYVETIRSSGEVLLNLLNDILDFSKIEAGRMELDIADFNLRAAVEETLELFSEQVRSKQLFVTDVIDPAVPSWVRGDPWRFRQILSNLVGNAIKFTEQGEVCLKASLEDNQNGKVRLHIEVSDTGIGISKEGSQRLFQLFSQTDSSMTRKFGGTGLGLVISKKLIEMMDGEIGVKSDVGVGSTFWLNVTFECAQGQAASTHHANLKEKRALVVSSTNNIGARLSEQLRLRGLTTQSLVLEPHTHLPPASWIDGGYDLLLLDAATPEAKDAVLAWLTSTDPVGRPPVLVVTYSGSALSSLHSGPKHDWVRKPLRQSDLYRRLAELLEGTASSSHVPRLPTLKSHDGNDRERASNAGMVLIAEDNTVNQKIVVRMLSKLGYRSDVVANGREAVASVQRMRYSAILMDCQMPEMDGFEATALIRAYESNLGVHSPIIAMTAHALKGDRERCHAAGMDDYLAKPVKLEDLERILRQWINNTMTTDNKPVEEETPVNLDVSMLNTWRNLTEEGEQDFLNELIDLFVEHTPPVLSEIRQSAELGDARILQRSAHKLKGSSAHVGAISMVQICERVESLAREGNVPDTWPLIDGLEKEFEQVKHSLIHEWKIQA